MVQAALTLEPQRSGFPFFWCLVWHMAANQQDCDWTKVGSHGKNLVSLIAELTFASVAFSALAILFSSPLSYTISDLEQSVLHFALEPSFEQ